MEPIDVDRLGPGEQFPEQPDRAGAWHPPVQIEPENAHEAEPIAHLKLGLVVRQTVKRLQQSSMT